MLVDLEWPGAELDLLPDPAGARRFMIFPTKIRAVPLQAAKA
jgi:hypothetical protein